MGAAVADWIPDIEKRTRFARLSVSSAEEVYAELRHYAVEEMSSVMPVGDEELEKRLLARGLPLIDIALASFGVHWEIVAALYNRSLKDDYADEGFRMGLRVACLANRVVLRGSTIWKQMTKAIEHDLPRLLADGDSAEVGALLSNEEIDDGLLKALYERSGPFSSLSDARWLHLIDLSSDNLRLSTRVDTEHGPDMGHRDIQKAVFALLEIAPVAPRSLRTLYRLLDRLNPADAVKPEASCVVGVLKRWSSVEIKDHKGHPEEGYYTTMSIVDEFRCVVASLYSTNSEDKSKGFIGSEGAIDVAERCAFYANDKLTAKEIKRYLERGPEAEIFSFAVIYNTSVLYDKKLRSLLEELCGGPEFSRRYRRRCEQIHRDWPNFDPRPTADWLLPDQERTENSDAAAALGASLDKKLSSLVERVSEMRKGMLLGFLVLVALFVVRQGF